MKNPTKPDRIAGSIVGGAIGDYLGAPLEGQSGPLRVGIPATSTITDDTQLTLATCEAIMRAGQVDPAAVAHSFAQWFQQRRISGIGSSTLKALRDLSVGAHWAVAGARGEMAAGNGAAMRIAPLAFCVDPFTEQGRQSVYDISSITHKNNEAYAGALAMAIAVAAEDFTFLPTVLANIPDSNTRDRLDLLFKKSQSGLSLLELGLEYVPSGYVADSVPLALLAAARAETKGFQQAVSEVIACGGDTDTTGSMVGQIIGSKIGLSGIPQELVSLPFGREPVVEIAKSFAGFVCDSL